MAVAFGTRRRAMRVLARRAGWMRVASSTGVVSLFWVFSQVGEKPGARA